MAKTLDFGKTVYDLVKEYPEVKDLMAQVGFKDITNPIALNTAGKIMTIPKGAAVKGIDMAVIVKAFETAGFEVTGVPEAGGAQTGETGAEEAAKESGQAAATDGKAGAAGEQAADADDDAGVAERQKLLQSYVKRLTDGEDLESVRADFVEHFASVDPLEIAKAEQSLIAAGTPVAEVTRLCDVHSALFHGATTEEKIANAEKAVNASAAAAGLGNAGTAKAADDSEGAKAAAAAGAALAAKLAGKGDTAKGAVSASSPVVKPEVIAAAQEGKAKREAAKTRAAELAEIPGHPLQVLKAENAGIQKAIEEVRAALLKEDIAAARAALAEVRKGGVHYAWKGDLIYPLLKTKYDVSGPSDVMWSVDDEIRDELGRLAATDVNDAEWKADLEKVLTRAEEMIYKETNILSAIVTQYFTEDEWKQIYRELKAYAPIYEEKREIWEEAEKVPAKAFFGKEAGASAGTGQTEGTGNAEGAGSTAGTSGDIRLGGGHMDARQISALLNTIPGEITFVDEHDINRFFNEGDKVFKRPGMALDREVFSCHSPKAEAMARAIINDFRDGRRDSVEVWMNKGGRDMLVRYMAVRDADGYVGTLEFVQDMEFAKEHYTNG